jgi:cysteine desulfurase
MISLVAMRKVYLDNNATTPVDPSVVEAMASFYLENYGNASSVHSYGQKARAAVEEAREAVADLIGASSREIVFTSGGTEADNLALKGIAARYGSPGNKIITVKTEHPAILKTSELLERQGFRVTYLDVDHNGITSIEAVEDEIDENTLLISMMYANNETGTIQPLADIASLARENGIFFHTDAVQGIGKTAVDVRELNVDLLSLSAHKFHGPKGVGALFVRDGVDLEPVMLGGSHERKRRGGTENVPGIVGLGKACRRADECRESFQTLAGKLRDRLEKGLRERIPDIVVNGADALRLPHVSNISFKGVQGESLLIGLDIEGIAVSTGAACSSGSVSPSHVLTAMGLPKESINGAIRFSLGRMSVEEDIEYLLEVAPAVVARMREMTPAGKN